VVVMIATRWHLDDPLGRTLEQIKSGTTKEDWTIFNFPALAEEDEPAWPESLGRKTGEPLWPERYDMPALEEIRQQVGEYWFAALYQQHPIPKFGGLFKAEWFNRRVKAAPYNCKRIRFWDPAASLSGCYSAGVLIAKDSQGNYFVEDC